jgi:uncharacterized protein
MREVSRTVQAPEGFGLDVISVPPGDDVQLDVRLESVVEGVLVTGTAETAVKGECVRCLEPVEYEFDVDVQELYYYPEVADRIAAEADEAGDDSESEEETSRLEGDYFDLRPVLRDAVVLALPLQPVCQDDCPGLCSECGVRLADDPDHHHDAADPRWAALQGLSAAPGDEGDGHQSSGTGNGAAENQEK